MNVFLVSATLAMLLGMEVNAVSMPGVLSDCNNYNDVQFAWYSCLNNTYRHWSVFSKPLRYAQDICREQERKKGCMREVFSKCDNIDVIMDSVEGTFAFCRGNEVDEAFANYLEHKYQEQYMVCEDTILGTDTECNNPKIKPWDTDTTLQDGMLHVYRWEASLEMCFGAFKERPSVPECGMASGLKALTDFLAIKSLQSTVGSSMYERFTPLLLAQTVVGFTLDGQ